VTRWPSYTKDYKRKKSGEDHLTEAETGKKKPDTVVAGKVKKTLGQVGNKAPKVLSAKWKVRKRNLEEEKDPERRRQMEKMYKNIDARKAKMDAAKHRESTKYEKQLRTRSSLKQPKLKDKDRDKD